MAIVCMNVPATLERIPESITSHEEYKSLDKSGWRRVQPTSVLIFNEKPQSQSPRNESSTPQVELKKNDKSKLKKLVEWDDDELVNNLNELIDEPITRKLFPNGNSKRENELREQQDKFKAIKKSFLNNGTGNDFRNKLVYHGQINTTDDAIKVVDGIKMTIKTKKPVRIDRRRFSAERTSNNLLSSWFARGQDSDERQSSSISNSTQPEASSNKITDQLDHLHSSSDWRPITLIRTRGRRSKDTTNSEQTKEADSNAKDMKSFKLEEDLRWRPITGSAGQAFKQKEPKVEEKILNSSSRMTKKDSVIYGLKTVDSPTRGGQPTINEPFDDEGGIITARSSDYISAEDSQVLKQRDSRLTRERVSSEEQKPLPLIKKEENSKWLPLEMTTTETPTTTLGSIRDSNSSSPEVPHRSSSDTNYIYSQPASQQHQTQELFRVPLQNGNNNGNNYYSNYLVQPPAQQLVASEQPTAPAQTLVEQPIVDTTSGQVPEMIDRVPEAPVSIMPIPVPLPESSYSTYSVPQSSGAGFQPAQPQPARDQNPYYGYYQQSQQQQQQAAFQPVRTPVAPAQPNPQPYGSYGQAQQQGQQPTVGSPTQPPPQVVRQEHHYHYYNQQPSQALSRSTGFNQPVQERALQANVLSSSQAPITSVIREVQPVFISQPIIQQQASSSTTTTTTTTTPAPQIIREIIKEVPVQTSLQQLPTRVLLPPPPPQTIAFVPAIAREQLDSPSFMQTYAATLTAPAQRVIRQLSSNMPQVTVKLPNTLPAAAGPLRLQSSIQQALQFAPTRLAAASAAALATASAQSVTRQTASFVIPPMPKKTTTFLTETQAVPTHTTIMHTTQFTPATRTTVYTTDHQTPPLRSAMSAGYKR